MSKEDVLFGAWVQGLADAHGIPPKELSANSGVHESTLSRFFNGIKPINDRQKIQLGMGLQKSINRRMEMTAR